MVAPSKEFSLCVLGSSGVGKTSFLDRLEGKVFKRGAVKATDTDVAVKYSIEVSTSSSSVILFNLFDWNWDVKRKSENINQQLMAKLEAFASKDTDATRPAAKRAA
jgi:GTPase SAR1 family protein